MEVGASNVFIPTARKSQVSPLLLHGVVMNGLIDSELFAGAVLHLQVTVKI